MMMKRKLSTDKNDTDDEDMVNNKRNNQAFLRS